jgi:hypothetical protein
MPKFLLILSLLLAVRALDIAVDPSSTANPPYVVSDLQSALNAFVDPANVQLLTHSNTITLFPGSYNQTQEIQNFTSIANASIGISISTADFQNNLTQPFNCSSLPVISVKNSSRWDLDTLDHVIFEGVYLTVETGDTQFNFTNISTVSFKNICFEDFDYHTDSSSDIFAFLFANITYVTVMDSTFFHNTGQTFSFNYFMNISFANAKIYYQQDASLNRTFYQ